MNLIWTFDEIYICMQVNLEIKATYACMQLCTQDDKACICIDELIFIKFMHIISNDVR